MSEYFCKGSWGIGNNCRTCSRCVATAAEAAGRLRDELDNARDQITQLREMLLGSQDMVTRTLAMCDEWKAMCVSMTADRDQWKAMCAKWEAFCGRMLASNGMTPQPPAG